MNKSRLNVKILEYLDNFQDVPSRIIARSVYAVPSGECLNTTVRVDTYRSLKNLIDNEFIERSLNKPASYRLTAYTRINRQADRVIHKPIKVMKEYKGRGHHNRGRIGSKQIFLWRDHR